VDWETLYPDAFLSAMSTGPSDHYPLVLNLSPDLHRGRRFQFQSFWTKVDGFLDVVQGAWTTQPDEPNPFKRLDRKLRATAKSLSSWSSKFIGNIKMKILLATEVILRLDVAMDSRLLSPEERALRRLLKKKLLGACFSRADLGSAKVASPLAPGGRRLYSFLPHPCQPQEAQELCRPSLGGRPTSDGSCG
jgi:hypothetical protein